MISEGQYGATAKETKPSVAETGLCTSLFVLFLNKEMHFYCIQIVTVDKWKLISLTF